MSAVRSDTAAQLLRKTVPVFVPRLCMRDPVERAGPSGTCEDAGESYSGLLATSMSGNGTC